MLVWADRLQHRLVAFQVFTPQGFVLCAQVVLVICNLFWPHQPEEELRVFQMVS